MPRAAMSVATSTRYLPDLNPSSACVRCVCDRLPWIRSALIPCFTSVSASRLARCFVRVNTSACFTSPRLSMWTSNNGLSDCDTG